MRIFKRVEDLKKMLKEQIVTKGNIGFVPTMGALHEGHLSLLRMSLAENHLSICSIFINPTQFNQTADLEKYPITTDRDIALLEKVGCDILFLPSAAEVYPEDLDTGIDIDLNGLDKVMEGAFRAGHFGGVMQVVKRLLGITTAENLYMGQKDYQQFAVIQRMIKALELPVNLVMVPTVREENGLAKSSRNARLTAAEIAQATVIYKTLRQVKTQVKTQDIKEIEMLALQTLTNAGLRPEYFQIVDGETLQAIETIKDTQKVVVCTAAWLGEVRLIDNIIIQ